MLTVLWVGEINGHTMWESCRPYADALRSFSLKVHVCAGLVFVPVCGFRAPRPSAARFYLQSPEPNRDSDTKQRISGAGVVAASAAGTAGGGRETHQAGLDSARPVWITPASVQLRPDHRCDRWLVSGWRQGSSWCWETERPSPQVCCWCEETSESDGTRRSCHREQRWQVLQVGELLLTK